MFVKCLLLSFNRFLLILADETLDFWFFFRGDRFHFHKLVLFESLCVHLLVIWCKIKASICIFALFWWISLFLVVDNTALDAAKILFRHFVKNFILIMEIYDPEIYFGPKLLLPFIFKGKCCSFWFLLFFIFPPKLLSGSIMLTVLFVIPFLGNLLTLFVSGYHWIKFVCALDLDNWLVGGWSGWTYIRGMNLSELWSLAASLHCCVWLENAFDVRR